MINKLFDLIKKNKYTDIKKIINDSSKKSVNFNFKFDNDNYFIEYVILSKNLNFIKFILDQDIALDILTSDGLLILHNVIKFFDEKNKQILNLILNSNAFSSTVGINLLEKQDLNNRTIFHYCILFNNLEALKILINKYLLNSQKKLKLDNLDFLVDSNGENIFFYSLTQEKSDILKYLLSLITNEEYMLKNVNFYGENLLNYAIKIDSPMSSAIDLLIENKLIDFNQKTYNENYTCYHLACLSENNWNLIEKFFKLIDDDFLWSQTDSLGNNILHLSINQNNFRLIELIIKNLEITIKSNNEYNDFLSYFLNFTNLQGYTPLHLLIDLTHKTKLEEIRNIIEVLIKYTDLNIQNNSGNTVIHSMLKNNSFLKFSDILTTKEINLFIENKKKETPYQLVKNYGDKDNMEIIDIVSKSYYNKLNALHSKVDSLDLIKKKLKNWEIRCIENPDKNFCIQNIKDLILSKKKDMIPRSILPEIDLNIDIDSGIPIIDSFFSGFQIDTLFGILFLLKNFNKKMNRLKLILDYPITTNDKLEETYNKLGINYIHDMNFNNIMIYWIHQHFVLPSRFLEMLKKEVLNKSIVIIPIGIELSNGAHSNILYCDFELGIVERFEPNGEKPPINFNYNPKLLDELIMKEIIDPISNGLEIRYIEPKEYLPPIGFSMIENYSDPNRKIGDPNGFCTVW